MKIDVTKMAYEDISSVMGSVSEGVEGFCRVGEKVFVQVSVGRLMALNGIEAI